MEAIFYNFNKKRNSTAIPTDDGITLEIKLKSPTSILSPTIELSPNVDVEVYKLNYCYIEKFNRYYAIINWNWINGIWSADCDVDVLASNRTSIAGIEALISRCSNSSGINKWIPDTIYPISTETKSTWISRRMTDYFVGDSPWDGGWYVVGINNGNGVTGVQDYYALDHVAFAAIISSLMAQNPFDFWSSIEKQVNPLQYINSIFWTPLKLNNFHNYFVTNKISIYHGQDGDLDIDVPEDGVCYQLKVPFGASEDTGLFVDFFLYLDDLYPSDWKDIYLAQYTIYAPLIGSITIPSEYIHQSLYLKYHIDIEAMKGVWSISNVVGTDVFASALISGSLTAGVAISYGTRENNIFETLVNTIRGGSAFPSIGANTKTVEGDAMVVKRESYNMDTGKMEQSKQIVGSMPYKATNWQGVVGGVFNGIGNLVQGAMSIGTTSKVSGSSESFATMTDYLYTLKVYTELLTETDNDHLGSPCGKKLKISNITGYIECKEVDFTSSDSIVNTPTLEEIKTIENLMTGGFYYE